MLLWVPEAFRRKGRERWKVLGTALALYVGAGQLLECCVPPELSCWLSCEVRCAGWDAVRLVLCWVL